METFSDSDLCSGSAADIFELPDTDTTVVSSNFVKITPFYNIQGADHGIPLSFLIPANQSQYMDLRSTFLYIKTKLTNIDGSALSSSDIVAPSSMFFYTMFKRCEIQVNGVSIVTPSDSYPYEAGIPTILSNGRDQEESALTSILYYKDTLPDVFDVTRNTGFNKRVQISAASSTFDMIGKIPVNLFLQQKYLPPRTEVCVSFVLGNPRFCLDCAAGTKDYTFRVEAAELHVRMHTLDPDIVSEHQKMFNKTKAAKYSFLDNMVYSINVPTGASLFESPAMFGGKLPTSLVVCMMSNDARAGKLTKSAWNFKDYGLKSLIFSSATNPALAGRIDLDFSKKLYQLGYYTLFSQPGLGNRGNGISRDDYTSGSTFYVVNLQEALCGDLHPILNGDIKVALEFDQPIPENATLLMFGSVEKVMELDGSGRVNIVIK